MHTLILKSRIDDIFTKFILFDIRYTQIKYNQLIYNFYSKSILFDALFLFKK